MIAPSAADKLHDFNARIAANGLYWTVPIPEDGLSLNDDGTYAVLDVTDVPIEDQPKFPNPGPSYPARVSMRVIWQGRGPRLGTTNPTDHFQLLFHNAVAQGWFKASVPSTGFTFESDAASTSESLFAVLAAEQNGVFFHAGDTDF